MVLNDPLANVLSKVMNNEKISKTECVLYPINSIIKNILNIMNSQGYVGSYEEIEDNKGNYIKLNLIGTINKCGVIKPRFSVTLDTFEKYEKRYLPARNIGFMIVSTSHGIMTHIEAKKKKIGGRLLAYCY